MSSDTPNLWAATRLKANHDHDAVVLIGTSRFQMGLDPDALMQHTQGLRVHQLAISGMSPLPILRSLAFDDDFVGDVICEFMPDRFFADVAAAIAPTERYLQAYASRSRVLGLEQSLVTALQTRLVTMHQQLNVREVAATIVRERSLPTPHYRFIHDSRFVAATFTPEVVAMEAGRDAHARSEQSHQPPVKTVAWPREDIRKWVDKIRSRGGSVTFFRINSDGKTREREQLLFPRSRYYDEFAKQIDNARWIHFEDIPPLREYACPDGDHLDGKDADDYARDLAPHLFPDHLRGDQSPR